MPTCMLIIMKACERSDCDRKRIARGLCSAHYQRLMRGASLDAPIQKYAPGEWGEWRVNNWGYVVRSRRINGVTEFELQHRKVWEEAHRPLGPGENVHHINGVKTDNRIENLELWLVAQPAGQRHSDMLEEYARILRENGYHVERG